MLGDIFDPTADLLVSQHIRPHWSQAGAIVFVTFRMGDSVPREVLQRWEREKTDWMQRQGHATSEHWSRVLPTLDDVQRGKFHKQFNRCREDFLDTCHGRCLLRRPELAKIVADSLVHFDAERYQLGDFVVMPNHVHLLAAFPAADAMREQFDSWLHYTAFRINQRIGEKGHFWQQEPFDHLVRSAEQYDYLRDYIAENPGKSKLKAGEFIYHRYER